MEKVKFDYSKAINFIGEHEFENMRPMLDVAHNLLHNKAGAGNNYTGWLQLPEEISNDELEEIIRTAEEIKGKCDAFIVVGIGGSYLGARSAIEMLTNHFHNYTSKDEKQTPNIYYAGHNISSTYLAQLIEIIKEKDVCVNVISKSGTTTEPALAFRALKNLLEKKYGKEEARKRIIATTDRKQGALKKLADEEGYKTFVIPDDVGGRFSVLTPVGLLPIAVAGIDITNIIEGAKACMENSYNSDISNNYCYQYAVARNILYSKGKTIELLVNYESALQYFGEWWKQLFGESEGKDYKGIFPATLNFSTDLHSMGQYIQEGKRNLFETVIQVKKPLEDIVINEEENNLDGLNYLAGKTISFVNEKALEATILAHVDGGVPNLIIGVPKLTPFYYGYLVYYFQKACGISGYLLGVNPFNQPGVEEYKRNMFALLGKPGFEKERAQLLKRLK
ncbi:glucose-6-phosphate isomerase [Alkaliphilus pronyensis]|uniref:Glucose-6-phosphate isomerase n=1 Tax=Alkaliphilus pronyensis TaxID=1482732 RepID=A0A6I0FGE0_9FIRM|nr:glucose-6-phosphate isomerase [Alkaliphilus pronyensis]KAB3535301.1 glucose-6-phosphate isomerase [Alkaliphilus pronyensis]